LDGLDLAEAGPEHDVGWVGVGGVPAVVEVIAEVEVRVLLVLRRASRERGRLAPALDHELVALGVLLARDDGDAEAAHAEVRLDPEEALPAPDQLALDGEEDVPGLDLLDDVVLVAGVGEADLVLEVEVVLGIVVDVDLELVPDGAGDAEAELLAEVRVHAPALAGGGLLLLVLAVGEADVDVGLAVDAEVHLVGAEDPGEGAVTAAGDLDVEQGEVPTALALAGALRDEVAVGRVEAEAEPLHPVGVEAEADGKADVLAPDALGDDVGGAGGIESLAALPVRAELEAEGGAAGSERRREGVAAEGGEQARGEAGVREDRRRVEQRRERICAGQRE